MSWSARSQSWLCPFNTIILQCSWPRLALLHGKEMYWELQITEKLSTCTVRYVQLRPRPDVYGCFWKRSISSPLSLSSTRKRWIWAPKLQVLKNRSQSKETVWRGRARREKKISISKKQKYPDTGGQGLILRRKDTLQITTHSPNLTQKKITR